MLDRTSPTLHPPYPPTVLYLSALKLSHCIYCVTSTLRVNTQFRKPRGMRSSCRGWTIKNVNNFGLSQRNIPMHGCSSSHMHRESKKTPLLAWSCLQRGHMQAILMTRILMVLHTHKYTPLSAAIKNTARDYKFIKQPNVNSEHACHNN